MKMLLPRYRYVILAIIIALAAVLRFWGTGDRDLLGDEATYAFRSVGYLDYLGTSFQTQPIEWYATTTLPAWTSLSFHDHPPLTFFINHIFLSLFGDSIVVARLPSVLWGLLAVCLTYVLARRMFRDTLDPPRLETFALFAAALIAIGNPAVGISRVALMESAVLAVTLLALYCFLRFTERPGSWWWAFGLSVGAAFLTKYTTFFLVPTLLVFLLLYEGGLFRNWRLYAAAALALLVFSPVIMYNIAMFKARGHFDLQFSYLLGQATPEWSGLVGKVEFPFSTITATLPAYFGAISLLLACAGAAAALGAARVRRSRGVMLILLYLVFATLLFIKIGAAARFLTLYAFPFALLGAMFLSWLMAQQRLRAAARVLVIGILLIECGRTLRANFFDYEDYGVAALDHYLEKEFNGKRSAAVPQSDNAHLNDVVASFAARAPRSHKPEKVIIVYNDNVALGTLEWIFYRRFFYHAIPALYIENFLRAAQEHGSDYFSGFTVYFVESTPATELNPFKENKGNGDVFEGDLLRNHVPLAASIKTAAGVEAFRVYKFEG